MSYKLIDWGPSPFSIKVRAILDYKGIAYERASVLQMRNLRALKRGGIGKAPALDIDGRLVVDSTNIALDLEQRVPSPAILPEDTRQRGLCLALEEWADESLYFIGLYYHWHDPEGRAQVPQVFGRGLTGRILYRVYLRKILRQLQGQGTSRKPPAHVQDDAVRQLQAIQALTRPGPFLLGEMPWLCDFALIGQLVYLSRTPVGGRLLASYPEIGAYMARMRNLRPRHAVV